MLLHMQCDARQQTFHYDILYYICMAISSATNSKRLWRHEIKLLLVQFAQVYLLKDIFRDPSSDTEIQ